MSAAELPIAVIGAGPVGLAAAAHLHEQGERFVVVEAGVSVGAAVRDWAHVRLFSPWSYVVDAPARRLLEARGWVPPEPAAYPTGGELVRAYLEPLAAHPAIAPHLRLEHRVTAVTRQGADKLVSQARGERPFELAVETPAGSQRLLARAVIDASGTWSRPNPAGSSGIAAPGEREAAATVTYRIPDATGADRHDHAGRTTLVIGAGHSAFNAILDLATLAEEHPATRVVWAVRRARTARLFGGGEADALVERGLLGTRVQQLLDRGVVELVTDFRTTALQPREDGTVVAGVGADGTPRTIGPVDRIVVNTGFRPELSLTSELRLELDPVVETTPKLAPLIDPNLHSCGTVRPHGAAELAHPEEPGYYSVGMKSYGRAPTFLLLTGYEQVRSVVAALVGDHEAAARVELELPETGVCNVDAVGDAAGALPTVAAGAGVCCG